MSVEWVMPPTGTRAVTKSDTTTDPAVSGGAQCFRAVWIDTAGNLKVTFKDGSTGVYAVAANTRFEGLITRVWDNGTTCGVTYGFL